MGRQGKSMAGVSTRSATMCHRRSQRSSWKPRPFSQSVDQCWRRPRRLACHSHPGPQDHRQSGGRQPPDAISGVDERKGAGKTTTAVMDFTTCMSRDDQPSTGSLEEAG